MRFNSALCRTFIVWGCCLGTSTGCGNPNGTAGDDVNSKHQVCDQECDLFDPNACGPEKMCTSWICDAEDDAWDRSVCAAIGAKQKGEACEQGWLGDQSTSCAKGLTCYAGVCVDTCIGSQSESRCAQDNEVCFVSNEGALATCLQRCNPLAPDCPDLLPHCFPRFGEGDHFCLSRIPEVGDKAYGESCTFGRDCNLGLTCLIPGRVDAPGCEATSCCSNICDRSVGPEQCVGSLEHCVAWFDPPVEGQDSLGVCMIPKLSN